MGVEGLSLIAGDAEVLGSANPQHTQKLKLIRHLRQLDLVGRVQVEVLLGSDVRRVGTEEAARQFIDELKRVAWRLPPYPRRIYALDPEAEKLLKNATTDLPGPLPRATPDVIDRVVPPVPTAPAPQ